MGNKRVKVIVRVKPVASLQSPPYSLDAATGSIDIHQPKRDEGAVNNQAERWHFSASNNDFERMLCDATQEQVFDEVASNMIHNGIMQGRNGTVLCYGQTGAGKTYTMTGVPNSYQHRGLIPRSIGKIFEEIMGSPEKMTSVRISYVEIYNELMFDLLSEADITQQSGDLLIRENEKGQVITKGLTQLLVGNEQEALQVFFAGNSARRVAEHTLNQASSRSHAVFTLHVERRDVFESSERVEYAKLNLVDLAGSERVKNTKSEGKTLQEASYINKSLTFLEQVVLALSEKKREHIPYRQAKLTHYLKDSLGGNCETKMIANIWPEATHVQETGSTMNFCRRMMKVTNNPEQNYDLDPKLLLRKYETEINALKMELKMHDTLANRGTIEYEPGPEDVAKLEKMVKQFLSGEPDVDAKALCSDAVTVRHHKLMFEMFKEQYEKREAELRERGGGGGYIPDEEGDPGYAQEAQEQEEAAGAGEVEQEEGGFALGHAKQDSRPPEERDMEDDMPGSPKEHVESPSGTMAPRPGDKQELFIAFKEKKEGREIENRFRQLKEDLKEAKGRHAAMIQEVNKQKRAIDETRKTLDMTAAATKDSGEHYPNDEDWRALSSAKAEYKARFQDQATQKQVVQDIEQKMRNAKVELVNAFNNWYTVNYGPERDADAGRVLDDFQDVGEQFDSMELDRLEAIHPEGAAAVPFFKARKEFRLHHGARRAM